MKERSGRLAAFMSASLNWTRTSAPIYFAKKHTHKKNSTHTQAEEEGQQAGNAHPQQIVRSELRGGSGNGETEQQNKWRRKNEDRRKREGTDGGSGTWKNTTAHLSTAGADTLPTRDKQQLERILTELKHKYGKTESKRKTLSQMFARWCLTESFVRQTLSGLIY